MATVKRTITIPEELDAELEAMDLESRSAYVTEAIEQRRRRDAVAAMLTEAGIPVTAQGVARLRARFEANRAQMGMRSKAA